MTSLKNMSRHQKKLCLQADDLSSGLEAVGLSVAEARREALFEKILHTIVIILC